MIKDTDIIEVYTEYEHNIFLPTQNPNGFGYTINGVINGEYVTTPIPFNDVKYINRISAVFRLGRLRVENENEEEILTALGINKNNGYYTKSKIEEMILEPNDEIVEEIIKIKDINIIDQFAAILTMLENTNEYDISAKVGTYIRARKEELNLGVTVTELKVKKTKNNNSNKIGKGKENK